ncbi:hypothetical protein DK412_08615 [Methylobacterium sp. 17Sr1-1]|nr:hypothetical protein DK412_08615 [Methylobacterium sp. 17Sr1-1]
MFPDETPPETPPHPRLPPRFGDDKVTKALSPPAGRGDCSRRGVPHTATRSGLTFPATANPALPA